MTDFSKLAKRYNAGLLGWVSRPFYAGIEAAAASCLKPGTRILDVGAGTGALLTRLVSKYQVVGTGIDPSEQMAEIASRAHPSLRIVTGNAEKLLFADNSFDVAIACLSYHHFDNAEQFIGEVKRVLIPGGKLFVAEPALPRIINAILRLSTRIIPHSEVFLSPSELIRQLSDFGLADASVAYQHRAVAVVSAKNGVAI